jgi:chromosome segregation ATPase
MAISVEAELPNSEIANAQLRAEMEAQAISLGKSQAQVTSLTAEVKQARSEAMYTQNAYRGIELQCKDLVAQRDNAINDGKGLRGQLSQSQARCTQFEKRLKVLETELERLKQMMRSAREALDGSAL